MKSLVLSILIALSLLLSACTQVDQSSVKGSGKLVTEERSVSGITGVDLATLGDLLITLGDQDKLTIKAEDNLLVYIETPVKNGVLTIQTQPNINFNPTQPISYALTVKSLESLAVSSLGSITASPLQATSFSVRVSSSGSISLAYLDAHALDVNLSSLGDLTIASGQVGRQKIEINSSGDYNAGEVQSQTAEVTLNSLGSATVWVTEKLTGEINSSGDIHYYGSPWVDVEMESLGKLVPEGEK